MVNVDMLVGALTDDPHNTILSHMLRDELVDQRDMTNVEALTVVLGVIRCALRAQAVAEATARLKPRAKGRSALRERIRQRLKIPGRSRWSVIVLAGDDPPCFQMSAGGQHEPPYDDLCVLVGADWILNPTEAGS